MSEEVTVEMIIQKCQESISHAWMVRTFIKHSEEVEDYPELMGISRSVFDIACALETRVNDPADYFRMLRRKLTRFRKAVDEFEEDYKNASMHTNFVQAAISIRACEKELSDLLDEGMELLISRQKPHQS